MRYYLCLVLIRSIFPSREIRESPIPQITITSITFINPCVDPAHHATLYCLGKIDRYGHRENEGSERTG
jgi:hypothetical protein